jgi:ketosteroid isomerase-like protein
MATQPKFDLDALRQALTARDAEAVAALYADDAEITMVDQTRPPSQPATLRGRDEIAAMLRDVMSRDLTHEVERAVEGADTLAYRVSCRYGDGTRVLAMSMAELRDGMIARETTLQAWDT